MKSNQTIYRVKRTPEGIVLTVSDDGTPQAANQLTPDASLALWNHSPDGFEMGYGGSGPAQLALAILLDFTDSPRLAVSLHQGFKWHFVSGWHSASAQLDGEQISQWIKEHGGLHDHLSSEKGAR